MNPVAMLAQARFDRCEDHGGESLGPTVNRGRVLQIAEGAHMAFHHMLVARADFMTSREGGMY